MSILSSQIDQPITLRDKIVESIRDLMYRQVLMPGDPIREQEIAKELGVSRTPLREAFIVLERDGLVDSVPNRGIFVREFDDVEIDEIFTVRTALENLAAKLIIGKLDASHYAELEYLLKQQEFALERNDLRVLGKLDRQFHWFFVGLSGNRRLGMMWKSIAAQYQAAIHYRAAAYPQYNERQLLEDHNLIIAAYRSGNLNDVCEANETINQRVAHQCIEGWRLRTDPAAR